MSNKHENPVLSVLIPARNRPIELASLISLIDDCSSDQVEFIVSDNSDTPLEILSLNPLFRSVRPEKILNMTANWNFAMSHAKGKYFTFVGDDDALIPGELNRLAAVLNETDADIVWHKRATYEWPDGKSSGNFYQEVQLNHKPLNLERQREKVLSLDYASLPIPYHDAVVKKRVVEKYLEQNSATEFFTSRTPDYNSGAKILFLSKTQIHYPHTVFISGAGSSSNGKLTWSNPLHPRAKEFTDLTRNPPPEWVPKIEVPIGFFWLHEAVLDALDQLGIRQSAGIKKVCYRSIVQSQNPEKQFCVAKLLWPSLFLTPIFARAIARTNYQLVKFGIVRLWRYSQIIFRVLVGRSQLFSIKGRGIMRDTKSLARYLESSRILDSRERVVRIRQ